jgi:hypothetical protein
MAWSYDPAELASSKLYQVRLIIGDTNEDTPLLQDDEIEYLLTQHNEDVNQVAVAAVNSISAKLAQDKDYSLGPYSESSAKVLTYYSNYAKQLDSHVYSGEPVGNVPTTTPAFSRNMFENNS